jgi:hypothetical protein
VALLDQAAAEESSHLGVVLDDEHAHRLEIVRFEMRVR